MPLGFVPQWLLPTDVRLWLVLVVGVMTGAVIGSRFGRSQDAEG